MKVICIKDIVTSTDHLGNQSERRDPFLVLGKVYDALFKGEEVIMFDSDNNWLSYNSNLFITTEEWRDRQLKDQKGCERD